MTRRIADFELRIGRETANRTLPNASQSAIEAMILKTRFFPIRNPQSAIRN
jgi:hypothetical protein